MVDGSGFLGFPRPFHIFAKNGANCSCLRTLAFVSFDHRRAGFATPLKTASRGCEEVGIKEAEMTGRVIKRLVIALVVVVAPFVRRRFRRFRQRRRRRTQEVNARQALDARCRGR